MVEDLVRRALLHDVALIHEEDAIADLAREAHFMGNDEHGHTSLSELTDNRQNFADHFRVEGGRWFIKEHDVRTHRQRTRDRHALLLTAGERRWINVCLVEQTDALQQFARGFVGFFLRDALDINRREGDVFQHTMPRFSRTLLMSVFGSVISVPSMMM